MISNNFIMFSVCSYEGYANDLLDKRKGKILKQNCT